MNASTPRLESACAFKTSVGGAFGYFGFRVVIMHGSVNHGDREYPTFIRRIPFHRRFLHKINFAGGKGKLLCREKAHIHYPSAIMATSPAISARSRNHTLLLAHKIVILAIQNHLERLSTAFPDFRHTDKHHREVSRRCFRRRLLHGIASLGLTASLAVYFMCMLLSFDADIIA